MKKDFNESREIVRTKNLADKLTGWTLQAGVGLFTLGQGFRMSSDYFNAIYSGKEELVNHVGNVGYMALQFGTPALMLGTAGIFTYIAVRGTGMFIDKLLSPDNSNSSQLH